ncbi:MAG: aspartate aminotransferase family protein [Fibrobacterota bacterium]
MADVQDSLFVNTYGRAEMPLMVRGEGSYLYDDGGRQYLDFVSGIAVNALGYANPALEKAVVKQASELIHCSNLFSTRPQIALAQKLVGASFADRVFFCNSGTEANEAAIKFARKRAVADSSSKTAVLSFYNCFHGRTYGAMTATAQKMFHRGFHPIPGGFHYAPLNDIEGTKQVLEGADFAAIIVEPVQGEGGLTSCSPEFLQFLRSFCDENGASLIYDEIQCGLGRSGKTWAYEHAGVEPDILTSAKPLGGGLPLGAVLVRENIARAVSPGDHGTTFGGNPVACAAGEVILDAVTDPAFLGDVRRKGEVLKKRLSSCVERHDEVSGYYGIGLLAGVRLKFDPAPLMAAAREEGLLLAKAKNNTVRFMPPLTVSERDIHRAVDLFEELLETGSGGENK